MSAFGRKLSRQSWVESGHARRLVHCCRFWETRRFSAKTSPMPLYYFNLFNDDVTMDDEGVELADDEAARAHAVKEARVMAADTVLHGHLTGSHRIGS